MRANAANHTGSLFREDALPAHATAMQFKEGGREARLGSIRRGGFSFPEEDERESDGAFGCKCGEPDHAVTVFSLLCGGAAAVPGSLLAVLK